MNTWILCVDSYSLQPWVVLSPAPCLLASVRAHDLIWLYSASFSLRSCFCQRVWTLSQDRRTTQRKMYHFYSSHCLQNSSLCALWVQSWTRGRVAPCIHPMHGGMTSIGMQPSAPAELGDLLDTTWLALLPLLRSFVSLILRGVPEDLALWLSYTCLPGCSGVESNTSCCFFFTHKWWWETSKK